MSPTVQARPYQNEAFKKLWSDLIAGQNGMLVLPTGSGKTGTPVKEDPGGHWRDLSRAIQWCEELQEIIGWTFEEAFGADPGSGSTFASEPVSEKKS